MAENLRAYAIVVDLASGHEQTPLDGLQQVGARALLLSALPPAFLQAKLEARHIEIDASVAGAVIVVELLTTSLEAAEQSARIAVGIALHSSSHLSTWRIVSSEARFDLLRQNIDWL
jgi:hypothetical protein